MAKAAEEVEGERQYREWRKGKMEESKEGKSRRMEGVVRGKKEMEGEGKIEIEI